MGEPLIYNLVSLYYLLFGKISKKIQYDLIPRQPYAYGILEAIKQAKNFNYSSIYLIEFGVASGAGIMNMHSIASQIEKEFKIKSIIVGFDTGKGMPPALDYRDHPEKYFEGDFIPINKEKLISILPENINIYWGEIKNTIKDFLRKKDPEIPIGFVSVDVDYYSSTADLLNVFKDKPSSYLPTVITYFDDINNIDHNSFCGELLAISEFNFKNKLRKIERIEFLREWRIFKNALWHKQIFNTYIFDHNFRTVNYNTNLRKQVSLDNPYL